MLIPIFIYCKNVFVAFYRVFNVFLLILISSQPCFYIYMYVLFVMVVMTRLRELVPKRHTERKPGEIDLPAGINRYEKPTEDQPDVGIVYEEQSYEAPVEDYSNRPLPGAENYTAPVAESSNQAYVEEEYQELGEADINYVVSEDSFA